MKARTVILLWLLAVMLGAAVYFVKRSDDGSGRGTTRLGAGDLLISDFPAEKVRSIAITGAEDGVTLENKDGEWKVVQRDGFPANQRDINDFLRTVKGLKVTQGIEAGPSFAPRFGMDINSSDPDAHGIRVVMKDGEGEELADLAFGKNLDAAASNSPFGGGATGRYVRNDDDQSGFYAVSEVFGTLSAEPKEWLRDEFLKVEKIERISVTIPGKDETEWELQRADEEGEFEFREAYPGVKIDPAAVAPLKSLFSFARFDDVVPAAGVAEIETPDAVRKVKIGTFEGLEYEITLQPRRVKPNPGSESDAESDAEDDAYLMTVKAEGTIPGGRKKAADEKKEDAEAADKAFTERSAELTENLEKMKGLEGRTFEVSRFTVGPLLKTRAELMSKGPGPAATAPPGEMGATAVTPPIAVPPAPPQIPEEPELPVKDSGSRDEPPADERGTVEEPGEREIDSAPVPPVSE